MGLNQTIQCTNTYRDYKAIPCLSGIQHGPTDLDSNPASTCAFAVLDFILFNGILDVSSDTLFAFEFQELVVQKGVIDGLAVLEYQ